MSPDDPVARVDLDGVWDFAYTAQLDRAGDGQSPALPDATAFCAQINVPGYWDD